MNSVDAAVVRQGERQQLECCCKPMIKLAFVQGKAHMPTLDAYVTQCTHVQTQSSMFHFPSVTAWVDRGPCASYVRSISTDQG